MVRQGFWIGDRDWWIIGYYNIKTQDDLNDIFNVLLASGSETEKARQAVKVLSKENTGYTFTNFNEHSTVVCASKASSYDEMFSTITHEIKHVTEHISEYYNVDSKSEKAAYLQGEISKQMYKAIALNICPICNCEHK